MLTVKNKFDTLQETSKRHTSNDGYESFVPISIEAAAEGILTQPRTKCRVPLESKTVKEKLDNI